MIPTLLCLPNTQVRHWCGERVGNSFATFVSRRGFANSYPWPAGLPRRMEIGILTGSVEEPIFRRVSAMERKTGIDHATHPAHVDHAEDARYPEGQNLRGQTNPAPES